MKILLRNIRIYTTDGEESVYSFSNSLTFIYGNVGAGKSTILNLIMYALGGSLIYTPAVKNCLKAVQLEVLLGEKLFRLFRMVNSNRIQIEDVFAGQRVSVFQNQISSFFYKQLSMPDLFQSIGNIGDRDVKLSFNNFAWFSYLKQSEMDNSFFYLDSDNTFKQNAAINVLFSFFESGYVKDKRINKEYRELKRRLRQYEDGIQVFNYIESIFGGKEKLDEEISAETANQLKIQIEKALSDTSYYNRSGISDLLKMQRKLDQLEYSMSFESKRKRYDKQLDNLRTKMENTVNSIQIEKSDRNPNVQQLYTLFLDCLVNIGFQGVSKYDTVSIDPKTYMPILKNPYENREVSFDNLGSGGKKTLFKICFALAIHRLQHKKQHLNYLPSFLIIDTPMKNISEREDSILYDRFYHFLFKLFSTELRDTQLIVVDKEKRDLAGYQFKEEYIMMRMTRDDWMNPPLFKNYKGL